MGKKLLSLLLALVMVVMVLPVTALAADEDGSVYSGQQTKVSVSVQVSADGQDWTSKVNFDSDTELWYNGVQKTSGDAIETFRVTNLRGETKVYAFDVVFKTPGAHVIEVVSTTPDINTGIFGIVIPGQKRSGSTSVDVLCSHATKTAVEGEKASCVKTERHDGVKDHWACDVCGALFETEDSTTPVEESALVIPWGHTLEEQKAVESTCTEKGHKTYWHCTVCDGCADQNNPTAPAAREPSFYDTDINPDNHSWLEAKNEETGMEYEKCEWCGKLRQGGENGEVVEDIPALHHLVYHPAVEATCEEDGWAAYWECVDDDCGKCFDSRTSTEAKSQEDYKIPATGHSTLEKCSAGEYWACTKCGKTFKDAEGKEPVELNGEGEHVHALISHEEAAGNCCKDGVKEHWECVACHKLFADKDAKTLMDSTVLDVDLSDVANHALKEVPETDTTKAYFQCERCGMGFASAEKGAEVVDPNEMGKTVEVDGQSLQFYAKVEPTCVKEGRIAHWKCTVTVGTTTKDLYFKDAEAKEPLTEKDLAIPALEHAWQAVAAVPATEERDGCKGYKRCAVCGMILVDGETEPCYLEDRPDCLTIPKIVGCVHDKMVVIASTVTCTKAGVAEHKKCECGELFTMSGEPTTLEALQRNALGHMALVHVDETETQKAYWYCPRTGCGARFADAAGTFPMGSIDKEPTEPEKPSTSLPYEELIHSKKEAIDVGKLDLSTTSKERLP